MRNISVIIPTYNAQNYIEKLLKALAGQTAKVKEIIVIDSSSSDDTVALAGVYTSNITVIPKSEFDHGGTRTLAAKKAVGDILVFLTQDALPVNECSIEYIVNVFENDSVAAAYGRQLSYSETSLFGKHLREFNYPDKSYVREYDDRRVYGLKTIFLSDSFSAYRRDALECVGWFKNSLILGEDTYVCALLLQAGYKVAYSAEAQVYHSHSYSMFQDFKRYFDIGVFHSCEDWILRDFGKVGGEGLKYIKSETRYLIQSGGWYLLPESYIRNMLKYAGYALGRHYQKLPRALIKLISMHSRWWNRNVEG